MKRRKIGRKTAKARVKASRRNAPKGAGIRTAVAEDTGTARLARERDEALHQQAATAEILKLISSSPTNAQPVFDAIVQSGLKLFPGAAICIALADGDKLQAAAFAEADPVRAKAWRRRWPVPITREYIHGVAFLDRKILDIPDGREAPPELAAGAKNFLASGYRAVTVMPMMRGRTAIGALSVVRLAPGKLSDRQLAALKTYAAQAVIAIENTRVLNELRQRTDDLSESLEQQTATSEVLKVISSSTGELQPVFQAMLENAVRICEAKFGILFRHEDGKFRQAATLNVSAAHADSLRQRDRFVPEPGVPLDRLLKTKKLIHTLDEAASANPAPAARLGGARSHIAVPMVKDDELVGAIVIYRQEVRPFTDKQIELVKNFAAQAVIAIENTRLLNELRERTDDLSESLEQQTATSEVLKIISSSPGQLEPVFNAMLENAVQICAAKFGSMILFEGDSYRRAALFNAPAAFLEQQAKNPVRPMSDSPTLTRVAKAKKTVQVADMLAEHPEEAIAKFGGARTVLCVPMLRDGRVVGVFSIYRQEVRSFTDKQTDLVKNFAAQAVIAIENARLLNELRQRTDDLSESLEQQTATSAVLKVISSTPGELEPVFEAILENATRICEAQFGVLFRTEGDAVRCVAMHGAPKPYVEERRRNPVIRPAPATMFGRALATRRPNSDRRHSRRDSILRRAVRLHRYPTCQSRRRPDGPCRPDAEGRRSHRCNPHLSPAGAAFYGQADRAARELRGPGRDRHREHAAAQRAARIAAAADRHRRRAEDHQSLDVRFAEGARYFDRVRQLTSARRTIRLFYCAKANRSALEHITALFRYTSPHGQSDADGPPGAPSLIVYRSTSTTFRPPPMSSRMAQTSRFASATGPFWRFLF